MSKSEGVSRIAKVIRGVGWLILGLGGLGFAYSNQSAPWVFPMVAAIFAAPCFAIAWIVDGFAK